MRPTTPKATTGPRGRRQELVAHGRLPFRAFFDPEKFRACNGSPTITEELLVKIAGTRPSTASDKPETNPTGAEGGGAGSRPGTPYLRAKLKFKVELNSVAEQENEGEGEDGRDADGLGGEGQPSPENAEGRAVGAAPEGLGDEQPPT